jgi:hypothetical protein
MKRCLVEIEQTKRTYVEIDVEYDASDAEINEAALEEAELADWKEEPPEVISIEITEEVS